MYHRIAVTIGIVFLTHLILWWRKSSLIYDILCWLNKRNASKPTNLEISEVATDNLVLKWMKPAHGSEHITSYTILCHSEDSQPNQWRIKMTSTKEKVKVINLDPKTTYIFKVRPESSSRYIVESDCSEPIETKPNVPGKPDRMPIASCVKERSVLLRWQKPVYGADLVTGYKVLHQVIDKIENEPNEVIIEGEGLVAYINGLEPETRYKFKVRALCEYGESAESDSSPSIRTKKALAKCIKMQAKKIGRSYSLELYALPMECVMEKKDREKVITKYVIGECEKSLNEKVLMLVGETGSGKTTLINGIANFVFGVRLEDSFRFKLNASEDSSNQANSQTKMVAAYTFYPMEGSPISYPLTIIDTPGFGDTEGIERDKEIVTQMHAFFSTKEEHGIDHLNAVGFVVKACDARLTTPQKYIFDSVLSIFGKDIASKIFVMATFADGEEPQVLSALKAAMIPCEKVFTFNNSALFANPNTKSITEILWNSGMENFGTLFTELGITHPESILLTKEVLDERLRLEALLQGLQDNISYGLDKFNELNSEKNKLNEHEKTMKINENFTYEVKTKKPYPVKLPSNQKALNCGKCSRTCHFPCELVTDNETYNCRIMSKHGSTDASCNVCPSKCSWKVHVLEDSRYELYEDPEKRTLNDLKARYIEAKVNVRRISDLIDQIENELSQKQDEVMELVREARRCKERLNEIALKPGKLTEVDYIELLIITEKSDKKDGYQERIEQLKKLQKAAKTLADVESLNTMSHESNTVTPTREDKLKWWTIFRQNN